MQRHRVLIGACSRNLRKIQSQLEGGDFFLADGWRGGLVTRHGEAGMCSEHKNTAPTERVVGFQACIYRSWTCDTATTTLLGGHCCRALTCAVMDVTTARAEQAEAQEGRSVEWGFTQ